MTVVITGLSQEEIKKETAAIKKATAKVLASKAAAREYLKAGGFMTKSGRLSVKYKR